MIDYIQIYEQVCYIVNLTWFICLVVEKAFASRSPLVTAHLGARYAEVLIVCMVHTGLNALSTAKARVFVIPARPSRILCSVFCFIHEILTL